MADAGHLLLFLGTEGGGVYDIAKACRALNLACGAPRENLRGIHAARAMPPHANIWIWQAARRFFFDLSLPPIAEAPKDRLTPEFLDYYTRLFARCLSQLPSPYICADHVAALVLDVLLDAQKRTSRKLATFFFYAHPAREISILRQKYGQPPALTEFVWRNAISAAIRHCGRNLRLERADQLDPEGWTNLWEQIISLYGGNGVGNLPRPSLPAAEPAHALAAPTLKLLEALEAHSRKPDWDRLEEAAEQNYVAQACQGGWQYVDTLDCGLDIYADQFLNRTGSLILPTDPQFPEAQAGDADWARLLDAAERKLVEARNDYEARLFALSSSLHNHYENMLQDEQLIKSQEPMTERPASRPAKRFSRRSNRLARRLGRHIIK